MYCIRIETGTYSTIVLLYHKFSKQYDAVSPGATGPTPRGEAVEYLLISQVHLSLQH